MTALLEFPSKNIFFMIDVILFKPAFYISQMLIKSCSFIVSNSSQFSICIKPSFFSAHGSSIFVVNLLTYYFLACTLVYMLSKIRRNK